MQGRSGHSAGAICWNWGLLLLLLVLCAAGQAQPPPPPPGPVQAFLTVPDPNVEVGRPFRVQLEVHHPSDLVILFPDTTGDFLPYELVKRYPVPTRSDESGSIDFTEYDLYSWAIDSVQYLRLPVGYVQDGDTAYTYSNEEALHFVPRIITPIDSLQVLAVSDLAPIAEPFNWTAFLVIGLGLVLLLVVLGIVFLPRIRKAMRRARIEREWKKYIGKLQQIPSLLPDQEGYLLELSRVWKSYYDRGWQRGLASLSTRELREALPFVEQLEARDRKDLLALNSEADYVVYAGRSLPEQQLREFYGQVERIMQQEYLRRKEAVEL